MDVFEFLGALRQREADLHPAVVTYLTKPFSDEHVGLLLHFEAEE